MKRFYFILFLSVFLTGCTGSIDYSSYDVINKSKILAIREWIIRYDTLDGKIISTDFLGGSTETRYADSKSTEDFIEQPYKIAEQRGKKLCEYIKIGLTNKTTIAGEGEGLIKVYRPRFKDKFILHTTVELYDNNFNKLATMDIFNRCDFDGRITEMSEDAMHDDEFGFHVADRIVNIMKQQ